MNQISVKNQDNVVKLDIKDVLSLMKQCRKSGVSSIKFQDLELEFHASEVAPKVTRKPKKGDDVSTEGYDVELDVLAITNPAEHEKRLLEEYSE